MSTAFGNNALMQYCSTDHMHNPSFKITKSSLTMLLVSLFLDQTCSILTLAECLAAED